MTVTLEVLRHAQRPESLRARRRVPPVRRRACKLCKRVIDLSEGVFFENGQTGRPSDVQCRTCTAWELAPERLPGNVRTDLVHYV